MGVSSTARLPSLGAQSIPPLFSHLQHTSNAKVVARWSITIRSFRAVPVPFNAWPSDSGPANEDAASTSAVQNAASASAASASGAPPLTKPRTMWQVWLSDHPGVVFVIVEDTGKSSRAKAWRDWEVAVKKWKKARRAEIEARKTREAQARLESENKKQSEAAEATAGSCATAAADPNATAHSTNDQTQPMDVDVAKTEGADSASGPASSAQPTHEEKEEEPIASAGARPRLQLPSHTRYTGGVDWRVRVGSVMGGGGRSAGAVVEAEFIPPAAVLPTSKFMQDFLMALFPPGLVPAQPAQPVQAAGVVNGAASAVGTPRGAHATLPGAAQSAQGGFNYTIGGGTEGVQPNRSFNIPVVSDQLWEEVVPRSGESWRQRISQRSHHMRAAKRLQRRQRASEPAAPHRITDTNGDDAFGWHSFGTDEHGADKEWQDDEVSCSDSEIEGALPNGHAAALAGTAVTMQQVDEDEDDDDDRPLGAPAWTQPKPNAAAQAEPNVAPKPSEDTVQLIFQGLRSDADDPEGDDVGAWSGVERGRRIAFQYVQMLRAEGII
ncbi:zinc-binding oxidoreductase [Moesziomyces antarcticus T-34]|uniref:Zinc-binding oxidoreductase n=1 Tax=Pseudozyma antarctica (strain T-34) TaxID=1151754 RepID=M9M6N7_PSEA3|nr:zinc-binding oxidoreductase [Moesziomyces antarcticus T-34]